MTTPDTTILVALITSVGGLGGAIIGLFSKVKAVHVLVNSRAKEQDLLIAELRKNILVLEGVIKGLSPSPQTIVPPAR